jgi:hypothetical protein
VSGDCHRRRVRSARCGLVSVRCRPVRLRSPDAASLVTSSVTDQGSRIRSPSHRGLRAGRTRLGPGRSSGHHHQERRSSTWQSEQVDGAVERGAEYPTSIPASWDDVTSEWMTSALSAVLPGARMGEVTLLLRDDGTNRRARLGLTYSAGTGPATCSQRPSPTLQVAGRSRAQRKPLQRSIAIPLRHRPTDRASIRVHSDHGRGGARLPDSDGRPRHTRR